uniref:tRNA (cytosine(38)-C(5))-methyltransferase n=1 Tax=Oreochromis aureus TaxID=47969 RepID=A0A668TM76_OREAU
MDNLRVLELYSGIGGMHYALKESGIPAQVVTAIDINTTANQVYKHNFPDTALWNKTIEGITLDEFNKLSFDMILMSPPCQPFTRLQRLPRFILLENVKGFETSSARARLVKTLTECGYTFQEIMISPISVGIPNSRLRYFLIAKISTEDLNTQAPSKILDFFPHLAESDSSEHPTFLSPACQGASQPEEGTDVLFKLETTAEAQRKIRQNSNLSVKQIKEFLEPQMEVNMEPYLLPPKTLLRYGLVLDIVQPTCRRSVCFTKGYGRYVQGTGSVLQCCMETKIESVFMGLDQCSEEEKLQRLLKLKLRYFSPREVANLMGFPQNLIFPEKIPTIQQYRLLGNSLNVVVVAKLLQLLVS